MLSLWLQHLCLLLEHSDDHIRIFALEIRQDTNPRKGLILKVILHVEISTKLIIKSINT